MFLLLSQKKRKKKRKKKTSETLYEELYRIYAYMRNCTACAVRMSMSQEAYVKGSSTTLTLPLNNSKRLYVAVQ